MATTLALFALLSWIYLSLLHGQFWQPLFDVVSTELEQWPSVVIVIPARNEAAALPQTLPSLLAQDYPGSWHIILVDDHSTDNTGTVAQKLAVEKNQIDRLTVISAPDVAEGWNGKVAAMNVAAAQSTEDFILFTDADIRHPPDSMRRLVARAVSHRLDLNSLMVKLNCSSFAEKLLIPAFVFFFAMLFPFRHANNMDSSVAAAAGGVMLVRKKALNNVGGLSTIKNALIDDCALAKVIKRAGGDYGAAGRTRLTLTEDVVSIRPYPTIASIRQMIARTAFTQLNHSPILLLGTVLGLAFLFLWPLIMIFAGEFSAAACGYIIWLLMTLLYRPTVFLYGLPLMWAFTLPIAAVIYIIATIDSAWQYWQGKGGQWKGRIQAR